MKKQRFAVFTAVIIAIVTLSVGFLGLKLSLYRKDESLRIDSGILCNKIYNASAGEQSSGASSASSVYKGGAVYIQPNCTYKMTGGTINGHEKKYGGAVYVSGGSTFEMTGGTISNCTATYGGAVYVESGGTFIFSGGTIENCSADNGYAVYIEEGGTFNYKDNENGFVNSGEADGLHIYAEAGADVVSPEIAINVYVDGNLSKTITKAGISYIIDESEMPLEYEQCCGYFYDEKLSECTNGVVDLTRMKNGEMNIYTKTASGTYNFTFTLNRTTNTYDIKASRTSMSGEIVLPKEYNNVQTNIKAATSYSNGAFYNCKSITGITFQDGLTTVSDFAFYYLTKLVGELVIPDSVTSIGEKAFYYCGGLTELTIGKGVTSIGDGAFQNCIGLTGSLTIPDSVTSIGFNTFFYCSGFTGSLTIPGSVTSIGVSAFYGCTGFTELTIEKGVASIGNGAFCSCSGLTGSLIIPDSVTIIDSNAFNSCSGLTGSLTIPDSVTSIGTAAFARCRGFTGSLIIPDSVTNIGNSAFDNCSGLTSVYIPASVTTIVATSSSFTLFYGCSSDLVIYTDVANEASKPSGWGTYWNYRSSSVKCTTNYNVTLEQYKAAVGLTFAPSGESQEDENNIFEYDISISKVVKGMSFLNYNQDVILKDESEYAILPEQIKTEN